MLPPNVARPAWPAAAFENATPPPPPTLCARMPTEAVPLVVMLALLSTEIVPPLPPEALPSFSEVEIGAVLLPPPPPTDCAKMPAEELALVMMVPDESAVIVTLPPLPAPPPVWPSISG